MTDLTPHNLHEKSEINKLFVLDIVVTYVLDGLLFTESFTFLKKIPWRCSDIFDSAEAYL